MWWRFFTFCVLVTFIIFVVVTAVYGKPVIHLFFHRCCGDDIENDQVIFENFGNNFLKERLVGGDIIEADNDTLFQENIERIDDISEVLSINDPEVKKWLNSDVPNTISDNLDTKEGYNGETDKGGNKTVTNNYELVEDVKDPIETRDETDSTREYLNVHNQIHKRMVGLL